MIGADNHSLEQAPSADPENWQVVHTYLLAEGRRADPRDCQPRGARREDRVYEFAFMGGLHKAERRHGPPRRPVAMRLRRYRLEARSARQARFMRNDGYGLSARTWTTATSSA